MNISPEAMASLISSSGSSNFGNSLLGMFHENLGIIACLGYQYTAHQLTPRKLMSSQKIGFHNIQAIDQSIDNWISNDYDNDPLFQYIRYNSTPIPSTHFLDINHLKNNDKKSESIVEKYYDPYDIGEEITLSYKQEDSLYTINLCRHKSSEKLSTTQKSFLTRVSNLILQSTIQHSKLLDMNLHAPQAQYAQDLACTNPPIIANEKQDKLEKISHILLQYPLTHREAEICAYITMGYSSIAISLILEISINTIATHRKRAYSKLNISSQRELFSLVYDQKKLS